MVPKFENIFSSAGTELPFLTQILVTASNFLRENVTMIIVGLVGGFFCTLSIQQNCSRKSYAG